ncbi:MAG: formate dehydrogenase accessory protein FdhE [Vicinamibacterales bacterium]|nr:formate dehydrogenase accessory protein FdhE [Vicinamibacterales bacterium]
MTDPEKPRFERQDPPEIAALKRVKHDQPTLATAVEMQIDIVTLQRRIRSRLSTPWITHEPEWIAARLAAGTPLLRFDDVTFDWMELRLLFRQMADVLARYDTLEPADHKTLLALARDSHPTADEVRSWFDARADRAMADWSCPHGTMFPQVLDLSARPFIERAAESVRAGADVTAWNRPYCPFCGADPEMASLTLDGGRRLHCGGCAAAWPFEAGTCPACGDASPRQQLSYASQGSPYRLLACNVCRRYLKAADMRYLDRPIMLSVDSIATLPLDAAAIQRGYVG